MVISVFEGETLCLRGLKLFWNIVCVKRKHVLSALGWKGSGKDEGLEAEDAAWCRGLGGDGGGTAGRRGGNGAQSPCE